MLQWPGFFLWGPRVQAFLATASVIALIVIALNLLLTCGLLLVCIYYTQRLIGRCSGWLEEGMAQGAVYAGQAADLTEKAAVRVTAPVIWAEAKVEQARKSGQSLIS